MIRPFDAFVDRRSSLTSISGKECACQNHAKAGNGETGVPVTPVQPYYISALAY